MELGPREVDFHARDLSPEGRAVEFGGRARLEAGQMCFSGAVHVWERDWSWVTLGCRHERA